MNLSDLESLYKTEKSYRVKQINQAIFRDLIDDWSQATILPLEMRSKLKAIFPLTINSKLVFSKRENSIKALITLKDGLKIESVLMRHQNRNTVCVSSQVGCALACSFCATGQAGFKRNLTSWEIVEQVLYFARLLKKENTSVTNIVFMGMGEPFLNYDNVLGAIKILNDKNGFNLGARHFSISTVGITEGIERLAKEPLQVNLAVSLHAPTNKLREKLMPVNKNYPIQKILAATDQYVSKTRRRVMFEYIMIKDVNDSVKCAAALARLMKKPLYFVNLISYNPTGIFKPSPSKIIEKFKKTLESAGVSVTQRYRFGRDIAAGCGQLASKNNNNLN